MFGARNLCLFAKERLKQTQLGIAKEPAGARQLCDWAVILNQNEATIPVSLKIGHEAFFIPNFDQGLQTAAKGGVPWNFFVVIICLPFRAVIDDLRQTFLSEEFPSRMNKGNRQVAMAVGEERVGFMSETPDFRGPAYRPGFF